MEEVKITWRHDKQHFVNIGGLNIHYNQHHLERDW